MSSFTSPLVVSPLSDGRRWRLVKPFTFHIGGQYSRHFISVPRDFLTDFASVPRFFWFLPDWATYSKAPVLHDWLYHQKTTTRKRADALFLEAMLIDWRHHRSRYFIAYMEYFAVRIFAWLAWKTKNTQKS